MLFLCFLVVRGDETLLAVRWPRFVAYNALLPWLPNPYKMGTVTFVAQMHVTAGEQLAQESGYVQALPAPVEPGYIPAVYSVDCEMV